MHFERRKPTWYQWLLQMVAPGVILAIVCWMAAGQVETKSSLREYQAESRGQFALVNKNLIDVAEEIRDHRLENLAVTEKNAILHHRDMIMPCTNCHDRKGNRK